MANAGSYIYDKNKGVWVSVMNNTPSIIKYENIEDAPVKTVKGKSDSQFVNIGGLDYGTYSLTGYYKLDVLHDVQESTDMPITIIVTYDSALGKKVVLYQSMEGGVLLQNVLIYNENSILEEHSKLEYGASYWENI